MSRIEFSLRRPMRLSRKIALLSVLTVCLMSGAEALPAPSVAQTPSAAPTVDQIISNYVRALGGEEAYHKLKTRVMKGVIHTAGSGEAGSIETFQVAPDKGTSTTYIPGDKPVTRGYDGSKGWSVDPDEGPQDATGDDLADIKDRFDFYRELRLKEIYPQMVYSGTETLGNLSAYVTEVKRGDGSSEKFYFDTRTGLLVQRDVPAPDSGGVRQTVFSDYRTVGGIQYPFKIVMSDPDFEAVIEYTEILHNVSVDESKFVKPVR
jgi:zinc protease